MDSIEDDVTQIEVNYYEELAFKMLILLNCCMWRIVTVKIAC